ncbi:MAG: hypothetical protein MAG451_00181 [Anaerolineales bacterium]|nr:hypothetical protein [Anaerolineales bacterium]
MRDRFRLLWVIMAVALVAPTATLDSQMLFADTETQPRIAQRLDQFSAPPTTPLLPLEYRLCPRDVRTLRYDVHVPPAPLQADILFAFDTTGSMDEVISAGQESAAEIMTNLQALIGDVRFGIVDFRDYSGFPLGEPGDWPYRLRQVLTPHTSDVQTSIDELESGGGGDVEEAYSRVLYEAYADQRIDWRPEARHFIVVFGDSVPHDDDLNAGIPTPQPYRPGRVWRSGPYPPPHLDPGRDAENGTDDDLDFQPVLSDLNSHSITLLFVVSEISNYLELLGLTVDDLLIYWQTWAGMTGPGGDARILEDAEALPATIQSLVTAAGRHVGQLTVSIVPAQFSQWVTVEPPAYADLVIPSSGLDREFDVAISVPPDTAPGQYSFELVAEGDGTVYVRQSVDITVPDSCFATPTPTWVPLPTPRPRWPLYLPYIARDYRGR